MPQGAEEADGVDSLTRVVRDQIGHGADWIKIYADYRWGTIGARRRRSHSTSSSCRRNGEERQHSGRGTRDHRGRNATRDARGR